MNSHYYLFPEETKLESFKKGMELFRHYQMNDFIGCEEQFRKLINDLNDIDIFYIITANLLISKLKSDRYKQENKGYLYFSQKVEIFLENNEIKTLLNLFYDKNIFNEFLSNYSISPNNNILFLIYSLRFCLNFQNNNNIYKNIFNQNAIELINNNYYPGNDISELKIYEVFSVIKYILPNISEENGCYICNCEPQSPYLHWVHSSDGFPTSNEKARCPQCNNAIKYEWFWSDEKATMVKRKDYFRIFKNEEILNRTSQRKKGNFETINSFWEKYVFEILKKERKGIISSSQEHFLKDNKHIRELSQIGYRLLNFILFSNLLFSSALGYINRNNLRRYCARDMTCLKMIENNWK